MVANKATNSWTYFFSKHIY